MWFLVILVFMLHLNVTPGVPKASCYTIILFFSSMS